MSRGPCGAAIFVAYPFAAFIIRERSMRRRVADSGTQE